MAHDRMQEPHVLQGRLELMYLMALFYLICDKSATPPQQRSDPAEQEG
jgi:hypothetical protein